jgi:SprT protein
MKDFIKSVIDETFKKANEIFNINIKQIPVKFDLRGRTAGQYVFCKGKPVDTNSYFRFNIDIANANKSTFNTTVVHEVAHYITDLKFGVSTKPHGKEWKYVMNCLGCEPKVTHNYTIPDSTKRLKYFNYTCSCEGKIHELSSILHNRVLKGQDRVCKRCKEKINYFK